MRLQPRLSMSAAPETSAEVSSAFSKQWACAFQTFGARWILVYESLLSPLSAANTLSCSSVTTTTTNFLMAQVWYDKIKCKRDKGKKANTTSATLHGALYRFNDDDDNNDVVKDSNLPI